MVLDGMWQILDNSRNLMPGWFCISEIILDNLSFDWLILFHHANLIFQFHPA